MSLRARNLRTIGALAALFLVPLALAFYTYYGTDWRPVSHVNHGELIIPPRPLPEPRLPRVALAAAPPGVAPRAPDDGGPTGGRLRERWSLVYLGDGACDADCRWTLYVMRQTRIGLNADMTRVERVFLATGSCCAREYLGQADAGLVVLEARGPAGAALLARFPTSGRAHTLYVVDPLGNLMMSYDARSNPHGLLEDLKKLLRLSHIG
ncbi:MAG: hypothetical protein ACRETG_10035 [Steroidobacteraceae bacterium]